MTPPGKIPAALIYGEDVHYLDHLAPLCCLLEMPLIVSEPSVATLAQTFYPNLQVLCYNPLTLPETLVRNYDLIFCCTPRCLFDGVFFLAQQGLKKRIQTIWCPHGNSDKGHHAPHIEALCDEEAALVYGPQMIRFLKSKGIARPLELSVATGNFRYAFYQEHAAFYDALTEKLLFQGLSPSFQHILYAPTWQDYEHSCSFFEAAPHLIEQLPSNAYLFIKLHPNLLQQKALELDLFMYKYRHHSRIRWIPPFPPIYPLLQKIDLYIGDMSSIGYDFLSFNRPMAFLNIHQRDSNSDLGAYLYRCGVEILPTAYPNIYGQLPGPDLSKNRRATYHDAFGGIEKPLSVLRRELIATYALLSPVPLS